MLNHTYTYRTIDLTTGFTLNDLPLQCDSLPRAVGGDADTTMTLQLGDPDVSALEPKKSTTPGRTGIFAMRDSVPVWGGIIWARKYSRATRQLELTCSTVESYWRHRVFNQRMTMTQKDQHYLFLWMVTGIWPFAGFTNIIERHQHWALGPNYDTYTTLDPIDSMFIRDYDGLQIRVADPLATVIYPYTADPDVPGSYLSTSRINGSGILRDRTYDAGKNVYDAIQELSALERGFEWTMDPTVVDAHDEYNGKQLGWVPRIASPRFSRLVDVTGFRFEAEMPGQVGADDPTSEGSNIEDYTYTEDARTGGNHVVSTGAEVNGQVIVSDRGRLDSLRAGYPLLELASSYSDVIYPATLDSHADGDLQAALLPNYTSTWTVSSDAEPEFGRYTFGDEAEFSVTDDMDPPQLEGFPGRSSVERIIGWVLKPSNDQQRERVDLLTNPTTQATAKFPPALKKRYEDWDRRVRGLSIVSRAPQSNVAVSSTNTQNVVLPNSGTTMVDGPVTVVTSFYFPKQADKLHALFLIVSGTAGANWDFYDTRDNTVISTTQTVAKGTASQNGSVYDCVCSLAGWSFGDMVEIEFRAYVTQTASTTTTRTLRSWAAYQGPK